MSQTSYTPAPAADFVLPFDLPDAGLRGRLVRLDAVSARALKAHALPEAAARAAGEVLALSALLGTALKLDGRLTVQTKSDGPLDLAACDYYGAEDGRAAGLRGFARVNEARLSALDNPAPPFAALAGAGSLAITIEPRLGKLGGGQTYQGITALSPEGIAASAETYFAQSEQLPTAIRLAAAPVFTHGEKAARWRAGGIMLQATPDRRKEVSDWDKYALFLKTVDDFELVDTTLKAEELLWRLFHEDDVRVLPSEAMIFRCDCSGDRIAAVLKGYPAEDRKGLADPDGIIRARCEFCGKVHEIAPNAL